MGPWTGMGQQKSQGEKGMVVKNHTMPKLRGYTNKSGKFKEKEDGPDYEYRKHADDINLKETQLYISANCFKHHLFREQAYDLHFAQTNNAIEALCSITGLVRGYMITKGTEPLKKQAALFVEDSVDQLGNGNVEILSRCGDRENEKGELKRDGKTEKKANSFFTKLTFGDTEYETYASFNIEELQFISLDSKFDRKALSVSEKNREKAAEAVQDFICSINTNPDLKPVATFGHYVRKGTIYHQSQEGILLNNDAIQVLIDVMINRIRELCIRQGQGYMVVQDVTVDYNDDKMMRIKDKSASLNPTPTADYAVYYEAVEHE